MVSINLFGQSRLAFEAEKLYMELGLNHPETVNTETKKRLKLILDAIKKNKLNKYSLADKDLKWLQAYDAKFTFLKNEHAKRRLESEESQWLQDPLHGKIAHFNKKLGRVEPLLTKQKLVPSQPNSPQQVLAVTEHKIFDFSPTADTENSISRSPSVSSDSPTFSQSSPTSSQGSPISRGYTPSASSRYGELTMHDNDDDKAEDNLEAADIAVEAVDTTADTNLLPQQFIVPEYSQPTVHLEQKKPAAQTSPIFPELDAATFKKIDAAYLQIRWALFSSQESKDCREAMKRENIITKLMREYECKEQDITPEMVDEATNAMAQQYLANPINRERGLGKTFIRFGIKYNPDYIPDFYAKRTAEIHFFKTITPEKIKVALAKKYKCEEKYINNYMIAQEYETIAQRYLANPANQNTGVAKKLARAGIKYNPNYKNDFHENAIAEINAVKAQECEAAMDEKNIIKHLTSLYDCEKKHLTKEIINETKTVIAQKYLENPDHRSTEFAKKLAAAGITFNIDHITTPSEKIKTQIQADKNCREELNEQKILTKLMKKYSCEKGYITQEMRDEEGYAIAQNYLKTADNRNSALAQILMAAGIQHDPAYRADFYERRKAGIIARKAEHQSQTDALQAGIAIAAENAANHPAGKPPKSLEALIKNRTEEINVQIKMQTMKVQRLNKKIEQLVKLSENEKQPSKKIHINIETDRISTEVIEIAKKLEHLKFDSAAIKNKIIKQFEPQSQLSIAIKQRLVLAA